MPHTPPDTTHAPPPAPANGPPDAHRAAAPPVPASAPPANPPVNPPANPPLPPPAAPAPPLSLRDFLTDASLAALLDELGRTTGVPIWLRDRTGEAVIPGGRDRPWIIVDEPAAHARAAQIAGRPFDPAGPGATELFDAPIRVTTGTLGAIVMQVWSEEDHADPRAEAQATRSLQTALVRLAAAISEGCEAQVSLRQRVLELGALYRLSAMLTETTDAARLLTAALTLAMEALRADAGSIAVIRDEESDPARAGSLEVVASRGLSEGFVTQHVSISKGGVLRMAALRGEVVAVPDMTADGRIDDVARIVHEGLKSLLSTGLMEQGRPVGLIRLYTRTPRRFTRAEQGLLRSIADQSAAAVINARLRRLREEDERVQRQVRLAADVQRRMLPTRNPDHPRFDIAARYVPSFELGGDFYDFIPLAGHVGVAVGDVSGKGVPAALLMSAVRASLRAHAQDVYDLDEAIRRVNVALAGDTRDHEFATLWYGVADPTTLRLTYCNAGHNPPLHFKAPPAGSPAGTIRQVDELNTGGMALGIDAAQQYERGGPIQLHAGDVLVAYTDGLTDASDFVSRRFGLGRLREAVLETLFHNPEASAAQIADGVFWHLRQFCGLAARTDDITLVVARVR